MKKLIVSLMVISLVGCATYRPIVDSKNVDNVAYEKDLRECQRYAEQVSPAQSAATGAVAGAIFGALLGAALGNRDMAGRAAGGMAVIGAAEGTGAGTSSQINIIRNCMSGRGYRVLN